MSPRVARLSLVDSNPANGAHYQMGFPLAGVVRLRHCFVARAPVAWLYLLSLVGVAARVLWGDCEDDSR